MTRSLRHLTVGLALAASLVLTACQSNAQKAGVDCVSGVEFEGVSYTAVTVVHPQTSSIGVAGPTACLKPVPGAPPVPVGAFPGYSVSKVLGGPDDYGDTIVYISQSLTLTELHRFEATYPPVR